MLLSELESELKMQFPEKFHKIYDSGAMKWLELSESELHQNLDDYLQDSGAFLNLNGLEPLLFDQSPERISHMEQWFFGYLEKEHDFIRRKDIKLIPFAQISCVDVYCFLYEENLKEPKIVLWWHDEDMPVLIANDFDEFLYNIMICSAYNEEDIHGENWNTHYKFLSEAYQKKIDSIPEEDLPYEEENNMHSAVNIWEQWRKILS